MVQQGSVAPLPAVSSHQLLSSPHSHPPSHLRSRVSGTVLSAIKMERGKLALGFKDVADKMGRQSGERQHGACVPRMLWGTEGYLTGAGVKQKEMWERVPLGSSS